MRLQAPQKKKPRAIQGTGFLVTFLSIWFSKARNQEHACGHHSERCGFNLSTFEYSLLSAEI